MSKIDLTVPDLGNFDEVAVVDVLVKVGDKIEVETPLVTLETDKATMDVPSTAAGTVTEVLVQKVACSKCCTIAVEDYWATQLFR